MKFPPDQPARVLVIDPVTETAGVIELTLRQNNECAVMRTEDPAEGYQRVLAGGVDLVLLDAFLPQDAGLDFCRTLRADPNWAHVPVILFSDASDRSAILQGFEAGAVDFVVKPIYPTELAARVRTHIELKRQKDLTLRRVVEQRELIQLMCHDISGPVGSVRMAIEMCEDNRDLFETTARPMLQSLDRVLELMDLVRQMRAFEDGKYEFEIRPWALDWLVDQACQALADRLTKKSIHVKTIKLKDLVVRVESVSFVNSVLANLLSNAAKFSEPGSTITVGATSDGDRVLLMVEDPGIGIPQKLADRLFDPDAATSRPGTADEPGTGYGMLLVKKFVDAYGGRIIVESRDIETHPTDHGTRIILDLPRGHLPATPEQDTRS
jgi:two-component system sensor histidine kinase/response regulator